MRLQLIVAAALTGLVWTVQLCVYRHFARLIDGLGEAGFRAYHAVYMRSIGYVAAPLMVAELALAITGVVMAAPSGAVAWGSLGLVVLVWLNTFAQMVPLHRRLQAGPSAELARRVCAANQIRLLVWTLRTVLLVGWAGAA